MRGRWSVGKSRVLLEDHPSNEKEWLDKVVPRQIKKSGWKVRLRPIVPAAAAAEDVVAAEQLVSNTDEGVATLVSSLFFFAFIGLSAITIGVIYLAVTDFLQKRESDKFEKEEASKKGKRKKKVGRARAGPRGFGQKLVQDEDDQED
ncbi:hypothetical protein CR513_29061, partial [Mucuna pruriens]